MSAPLYDYRTELRSADNLLRSASFCSIRRLLAEALEMIRAIDPTSAIVIAMMSVLCKYMVSLSVRVSLYDYRTGAVGVRPKD